MTDSGRSTLTTSVEDRFDAFFSKHVGYVRRSLWRYGVAEADLDDLTQEVFLRIYGAFTDYDADRPPKPWIATFAFHAASNHRRLAYHRRELSSTDEDDAVAMSHGPEASAVANEQLRLLQSALNLLSDSHRATFVMSEIDGFSGPEIASVMKVPLNTVYSRVRLARRAVEATLDEEGGARP